MVNPYMRNEDLCSADFAEDMIDFITLPQIKSDFEETRRRYNLSIAEYVVFFVPNEFRRFLRSRGKM